MTLELNQDSINSFSGQICGSYHRRSIFGGTILGQSILAAYNTVDPIMHLHSFQVYFLLRGNISEKINYVVETVMNGRSFVKRSVFVKQNESTIAKIFLSFKVDEPPTSFAYLPQFPIVKGPEECVSITDVIQEKLSNIQDSTLLGRLQEYANWLSDFPIAVKVLDPEVQLLCTPNSTNRLFKWLKLKDESVIDLRRPSSKLAILGFMSDYVILQPILTMRCNESVGFMVSLDHNMWFHNHKFDPTQWILIEAECLISNNGTTLNSGRIWSEDGSLLATVMQEGVIRPKI